MKFGWVYLSAIDLTKQIKWVDETPDDPSDPLLNLIERSDVVEHEDDMDAINRTWAFKCKQFPKETVKKFKLAFVLMGINN